MERRYVKDAIQALSRLGCTGLLSLKIGTDHHVSGYRPSGEHVYLHDVPDVAKLILDLARERAGAARA